MVLGDLNDEPGAATIKILYCPAPDSIDDDLNSRRDTPASDHRPLIATVDL